MSTADNVSRLVNKAMEVRSIARECVGSIETSRMEQAGLAGLSITVFHCPPEVIEEAATYGQRRVSTNGLGQEWDVVTVGPLTLLSPQRPASDDAAATARMEPVP